MPDSVNEGSTHTYTFTITDPGADTFTRPWSTTAVPTAPGRQTVQHGQRRGQLRLHVPRRPGPSTRQRHGQRLRWRRRHRHRSIGHRRQRQAEHHPDRCRRPPTRVRPRPTASPSPTRGRTPTRSPPPAGPNGAKVTGSDAYDAATGAGSFQCFFADGPATTNVTATVTDSDGATDTDNQVVVVTVNNVAPTVTLAAGNDLSVDEGSQRHLQLHRQRSGCGHLHRGRASSCGANGTQVGSTTTTATGGSFVCSLPRRPGHLRRVGPGQGLRRALTQHRHPDRHGRQRRPDGDPVRPATARRGHDAHLQLHHHRPRHRHLRAAIDRLRRQRHQVGPTPSTRHRCGQLRLLVPRRPGHLDGVSVQSSDSDGANSDTDSIDVTIANVTRRSPCRVRRPR